MTDKGKDLMQTMDAHIWATEFMKDQAKIIQTEPNAPTIDYEFMLAWFSSAIMTGWDHAKNSVPITRANMIEIIEESFYFARNSDQNEVEKITDTLLARWFHDKT